MLDGVTVLECLLDCNHREMSRSVGQLRSMRTYSVSLVRDIWGRAHDSYTEFQALPQRIRTLVVVVDDELVAVNSVENTALNRISRCIGT